MGTKQGDVTITVQCSGEVRVTSNGTEPVIECNAEIAAEFLLNSLRVLSMSGRNLAFHQNPAYKHTYEALLSVIAQTWPGINEYTVVATALADPRHCIKSIAEHLVDERQYRLALATFGLPAQRESN